MLSKTLKRGEHITVVELERPVVIRARTTWAARGRVGYNPVVKTDRVGVSLRRRDEGTTWARGWDGLDADALRAQVLLVRSTR